jgi:hypothetical protein
MLLGSKLNTLLKVLKKLGFSSMLSLITSKILQSIKISSPTENTDNSYEGVSSISELDELKISHILNIDLLEIRDLLKKYESFWNDFSLKIAKPRKDFFDSIFDLGPSASKLLFILSMITIPKTIIETGVAAGRSSNIALAALNINEGGNLISFDITNRVGELINPEFRNKWILFVLPKIGRRREFQRQIRKISNCGLFIHDSDHSFKWQVFEFESVLNRFPEVPYLIIDDIDRELFDLMKRKYPNLEVVLLDEGKKFSALCINRV